MDNLPEPSLIPDAAQILHIQPGDILVIITSRFVTPGAAARIKAQVLERIPTLRDVMIGSGVDQLRVLRESTAPASGGHSE